MTTQETTAKNLASGVLSLVLALFLVDGLISLLDDSLVLAVDSHVLSPLRGLVALAFMLVSILLYLAMGVTPMIPKRYFLPVSLFTAGALAALIPVSIYASGHMQRVALATSLVQVFLALGLIVVMKRRPIARWPWVTGKHLGPRLFSWMNLFGFAAVNGLLVVPGIVLYLALCLSLAVDHFSGSFLALHRDGLSMQARKYTRPDGKTIHLVPMMHIGEPAFYEQVNRAIPTNATVLVEGVTDHKNLLERKLSYARMARSLGLAEQQEEFEPERNVAVHADVDVEMFTRNTIEFLKLASLLHTDGPTLEIFQKIIEKSQNPTLPRELWDDILHKRNAHLLGVIERLLPDTDVMVVPWGAAHMPGLANDLIQQGFKIAEVSNLQVLRFGTLLGGVFTAAPPAEAGLAAEE